MYTSGKIILLYNEKVLRIIHGGVEKWKKIYEKALQIDFHDMCQKE